MKDIFIKYNPYNLETVITVDGQAVKKNSALNIGEKRLQEWIEDLPEILVDECNVKEFNVKFHGTILDYEDVLSVSNAAKKHGVNITSEHIPAKEVSDKEHAIEEIFEEIQNGPFEELKQKDVVKAFDIARSSEFPVSVVATMSAGKSTLINAFLNQRLMPAKQEACTATITEIKDNDDNCFYATVYDKNGELIETHPELTLEIMNELNSNPSVSKIIAEGNIPFVESNDVALVLVDTPGPNNSRDPEHKAATYRMLKESSKTLVLYIMNATQLAVNDDYALLSHVAESMKVGGKQSKDRFIFVVNKLDDFKQGEDSVESAIDKVRRYLEDKGIENPNIFPASALTALDIRTTFKDVDLSPEKLSLIMTNPQLMMIYSKIIGINQNEELHLEKYAPLTPSMKGEITNALAVARENNDIKAEALVHTGIIPIEAAIKMFVAKYAKTAKIKNIVDTFSKKLESAKTFENTKQEIATNQEKKNEILAQIEAINSKLKNGEEAKAFKDTIDRLNYDSEIKVTADKIIKEAQAEISAQLSSCERRLSKIEAENICKVFLSFADDLQANVQVKLEEVITKQIQTNAQELLEQYKSKINELSGDLKISDINVSPFELINGEVSTFANTTNMVNSLVKEETVVVKESRWIENTSKKWYKPWTWFSSSGHWTDEITEKREFIEGGELAKKFFAPIQKQLFTNSKNAQDYAKSQTMAIKKEFKNKFDELDKILEMKFEELKVYATDAENTEVQIQETKKRLEWLENIQNKIEAILEI